MNIQLVLAGNYSSCQNTQKIWSDACQQNDLPLTVIELESTTGTTLAQSLDLKTFPALIVNGEVKAVGHPDPESAFKLISSISKRG